MSYDNKVKDIILSLQKKYANSSWKEILFHIFKTEDFDMAIRQLLSDVDAKQMFTPHLKNIFKSLDLCTLEGANTIIINAYPYDQKGVADGLAFSTQLTDINAIDPVCRTFNESLEQADNNHPDAGYNLEYLTKQGVLLWNVALTAPIGKQEDHFPMWKTTSELILKYLNHKKENFVFVFVGEKTYDLRNQVKGDKNLKFFLPDVSNDWDNIDSFNAINAILEKQKKHPISW